jgi:hypothetical protein
MGRPHVALQIPFSSATPQEVLSANSALTIPLLRASCGPRRATDAKLQGAALRVALASWLFRPRPSTEPHAAFTQSALIRRATHPSWQANQKYLHTGISS